MNPADRSSPGAPSPGNAFDRKTAGLTGWVPWILVATLGVLCLWLSQLYSTVQAENAVLRDQQRLAELQLRGVEQRAEAERILARRELADLRQRLSQQP